MNIWDLGGPRRFLEGIHDCLRNSQSVVLGQPSHTTNHDGLRYALESSVDKAGWSRASTIDASASADLVPGDLLALGLGIDIGQEHATGRRLCELMTPNQVCLVDGVGEGHWPAWREFLVDFTRATQSKTTWERPMLVVLVNGVGPDALKLNAPSAKVVLFDDVLNEIDALTYAMERIQASPVADNLSSRRKLVMANMVAKIALWDLDLADRLVELGELGVHQPGQLLDALWQESPWSQEGGQPQWARGQKAKMWGISALHSVQCVESSPVTIDKRLWSGQAAQLMPLIEVIRAANLNRCARFVNLPVMTPAGMCRHIEDMEIGALAHNIRICKDADPQLVGLLNMLASARNLLAHATPLEPHMAVEICKVADALQV